MRCGPQWFLGTRSSIEYTFLLGLFVLCTTGGKTSTEWTCSREPNQGSDCILEYIDCSSEEGMARVESLWSIAPLLKSAESLTLTPVFSELVPSNADIAGCSEYRWYPKLNITWQAAATQRATTFIVSINNCEKYSGQEEPPCDKEQCLKIKVDTSSAQEGAPPLVITLSSARPLTTYGHIVVRVTDIQQPLSKTLEASISLPRNVSKNHIYGMPTHFRELVPVVYRNISTLNLLNWISPFNIWNSSCSKAIRFQFQIMPDNEFVKGYNVTLKNIDSTGPETELKQYYEPGPSETIGNITFNNLTTGKYYIKLELNRYYCKCSRSQEKSCRLCYDDRKLCRSVVSGYIHMSDPGFCVKPIIIDNTSSKVLAISLGVGAAVLLVLALAWAHYKFKTRRSEPPQCRKTVLILYCKENEKHTDAVLKFANLLNAHGMCKVVLDEWESNNIHKTSIYDWLIQQTDRADMVVVVGSEGANNVITARAEQRWLPALERAFLFGGIFPWAVRILQDRISSLSDNNIFAVAFEYTQISGLRQSLRKMRCGPHFYRLTADLGKVLQHIHSRADRYVEDNFKNQATEMLSCEEGRELLASISRAKEFHEGNTRWFTERYGHSEPIPNQNDRKREDATNIPNETQQVTCLVNPTTNSGYLNDGPSSYNNCVTQSLLEHS